LSVFFTSKIHAVQTNKVSDVSGESAIKAFLEKRPPIFQVEFQTTDLKTGESVLYEGGWNTNSFYLQDICKRRLKSAAGGARKVLHPPGKADWICRSSSSS
jgi:hypothetical protein